MAGQVWEIGAKLSARERVLVLLLRKIARIERKEMKEYTKEELKKMKNEALDALKMPLIDRLEIYLKVMFLKLLLKK